jgi:uncharacterized protein (DUF2461 family)
MVPVQERDLLEQDPVIRGQTYVCLSFLSPEEIIRNKETYYFENYVQHVSVKLNELMNGLEEQYKEDSDKFRSIKEEYEYLFKPDMIHDEFNRFCQNNKEVLDVDFNKKYDFQTNVRGIKVRGVYDSIEEAKVRCEHLKKLDQNKFQIYIGEVGCWCPWNPNPDEIKDQQYAVDSLNTLMHEYDKNIQSKNEHYAERKAELKERIEENEKLKDAERQLESDKADELVESLSNTTVTQIQESIEENVHAVEQSNLTE